MRRFVSLTSACTLILFAFASFARAQQIDIAVGGGTLFSAKPISASQAYLPPAEKGGNYPSASVEIIFKNHFGFNAEGAFRYKEGSYNGAQKYRPVLYDLNGVFAPRFSRRTTGDFLAGIGGESLLFYNQSSGCTTSAGSCPLYVNSNHFLVHAGGGVRYYFWRHFFVRPEAHYYRVVNNFEFHSGNLLRAGVSIGYTFAPE